MTIGSTSGVLERAQAGDGDGVVGALAGLSERERRALAHPVSAVMREHRDRGHWGCDACGPLRLAEFGVVAASRVKPLKPHLPAHWRGVQEDPRYETVLRLRPRKWRQALLERANWRLGLPWEVAYRLVREGLCESPQSPWYVAASVPCIDLWHDDERWLEHDFWRLFMVEDAADDLSKPFRGAGTPPWLAKVFDLAGDERRVSRDRVLDASLGALRRDFAPRATHFYRALFEALRPTPDELHERQPALRSLLSAQDQRDVGFALKHLARLQAVHALDTNQFIEAAAPAVTSAVKKNALLTIKTIDSAVRADPTLARDAASSLIEGLTHERSDIQRAALEVLRPHFDLLTAAELTTLTDTADDLDPTVRAALPAGNAELPACSRDRPAPLPPRPQLRDADRMRPINTPAELTDRARKLKPDRAPDEIEMLIDGLARLPDTKIILGDAEVTRAWRTSLGHSVLSLLGRRELTVRATDTRRGIMPHLVLQNRISELMSGERASAPLGTPTHTGGWIDQAEAARRLAALTSPAGPWDLAQMLMRLWPHDDHASLRRAAPAPRGAEALIIAYALGHPVQPPTRPGPLAPAWEIAGLIRQPEEHEAAARREAAAQREDLKRGWASRASHKFFYFPPESVESWDGPWGPAIADHHFHPPTDPFESLDGPWAQAIEFLPWLSTVWPANHEPIYRTITRWLWRAQSTAQWPEVIVPVIALLSDARTPAGPEAGLATAMCLGTNVVTLRAAVTENVAQAIAIGKVDGTWLGRGLGDALRDHRDIEGVRSFDRSLAAIPARWVTPLTNIARTSANAAYHIQTAIETILTAAQPSDRRNLTGLLELLRQLALRDGRPVQNPDARRYLSEYSPSSTGGRIARDLALRSDTTDLPTDTSPAVSRKTTASSDSPQ